MTIAKTISIREDVFKRIEKARGPKNLSSYINEVFENLLGGKKHEKNTK